MHIEGAGKEAHRRTELEESRENYQTGAVVRRQR